MRHDYDLPPDWDDLSDSERSEWMTQERCRRQAKRQATATANRIEKRKERFERRLSAAGYEPVDDRR